MWSYVVIMASLASWARLSAGMVDMSNLCNGFRNGDVVSNPFDCQSYFICNTVPELRYCDEGLHFDKALKLCNWPEFADCQVNRPDSPTPAPGTDNPDSLDFGWFAPKPRPTFVAIDVDTGLQTDPLAKYNPKHVECRHFGAYFLPHPRTCRRYFLCAYGHLHQHQCGRGTLWNYKTAECELAAEAACYDNSNVSDETIDDIDEQYEAATDALTTTDVSKTTAALPTASTPQNPTTVCFVIDMAHTTLDATYATTRLTTAAPVDVTTMATTMSTTRATTAAPIVVSTASSTVATTAGTTADPTTTASAATATDTPNSTPRVDTVVLSCPSNRQAYLPHKRDCTKYFICIVGMPVLTSCPDGLYWNHNSEFCDSPKNVDCPMQ